MQPVLEHAKLLRIPRKSEPMEIRGMRAWKAAHVVAQTLLPRCWVGSINKMAMSMWCNPAWVLQELQVLEVRELKVATEAALE